jgi:signal transduction histidine kinase
MPLWRIFDDVLHEVRGKANEKGVQLAVVEPLPDVVVDARRVSLVLMNLVWNAVKYSDPAKPERWVRLGARRVGGDEWQGFVADNGLGLPAGARDRIFEASYRAHPHAAPGSGFGLSITQEAVRQLGGRLWVESSDGLGSTFYFTVPDSPALSVGEPDAGTRQGEQEAAQ